MAKILLTNSGLYALVDDQDFDMVSQYRWRSKRDGNKVYAKTQVKDGLRYRDISLHRLILGAISGQVVDHRNGHRLRGKWQAAIKVDGKNIYLGLLNSEEDAGKAYDKAAQIYHGDFAWLNFPVRHP